MSKKNEIKRKKIEEAIQRDIKSREQKIVYLGVLVERINENQKSMRNIFFFLVLVVFLFYMMSEAKIPEIAIGPVSVNDTSLIFKLLPAAFSFRYYKYLMVWFDLIDQKETYKVLTSLLFETEQNSYLNIRIRPFSLSDSIDRFHTQEKLNFTGILSNIFWLPALFIIVISPFLFEIYMIYELIHLSDASSGINLIFIIIPVIILIFTFLIFLKVLEKIKNESF